MANKTPQSLKSTLEPLQISIKGYTETTYLASIPSNYDMILGKKWTTEHKAKIDCYNNKVTFQHKGKTYRVVATDPKEPHFISANSITTDLKKKIPLYAVFLRKIPENKERNQESPRNPELKALLREFNDVFPEKLPPGLPPPRSQDFHIQLKEKVVPQKKGLYRMSSAELAELKSQLTELTDQGFIRPSASPWGSPVIFVSKKDGSLRMCVDYRALNRLTVKNSYPLPRIDDILDQLFEAKYFTKIDLRSGFHQIRLDKESIPLTAFRTRYGHFEFLVLPFGLTNAPATFMTLMHEIFKENLDDFIIIYLDDILIYSKTWEEHLKHVRATLEILRKNKLFAKLSKCTFGVREVDYLGFILRSNGVAINPHKTSAIKEWPTPKSKKDVQSFLGLINYYRRFIRDCSKIARPLTELTKDVPFAWSKTTQKSFEHLKNKITSAPVLKTFDPRLPVFVTTDASSVAIGAVLEQETKGERLPVAFTSRTLNPAERNYSPHELELLAIVDTLRAWRPYLHGRKFIVHTDHQPLRYLQTQEHLSSRQVRWLERMVEFDFKIVPIRGHSNKVADGLSRMAQDVPSKEEHNKEILQKVLTKATTEINAISTVTRNPRILEELAQEYNKDPEFRSMFRNPSGYFTKKDSLLYYRNRLCVPRGNFRKNLLHDYHTVPITGHLGSRKTYLRLQPDYYWKGLKATIEKFVASCSTCQETKSQNHRPFGYLKPLQPPESKWTDVTMDFITPLPKTPRNHTGLLNVVDRLSKMIRLIPIPPKVDAPLVAKLFKDHVYRHHGLPQVIISDRDPIFMSKFWDTLFKLLNTKITPSSAYHPQTDGQTEIVNRKVEEMIRAFSKFDKTNWDENIVDFEVAYNSSVHSTTLFTPFFLNYGIHPRTIPIQTLSSNIPAVGSFIKNTQKNIRFAQENIRKSNEAAARYANKRRSPHQFKINDEVWLSTKNLSLEDGSGNRKLHPKYCGPFKITEKINDVTFRLDLSKPMLKRGVHNAFHVNLFRPFVPDEFDRHPKPPPPLQFEDSHKEFEVESILSHRKYRGQSQYLVKWKGYPDHENTWLYTKDLKNCQELLQEYNASRRC